MNKLSLYTLLILLFLGLSKSFSPSEKKTLLIPNKDSIGHYFPGAPISVVLAETFQIGFLINTYFMRLNIIHGFKSPEEIIIRTSQEFWKENQKNIGMSLFRRDENLGKESTLPLPPGSLYIGNLSYGRWRYKNSGDKVWSFHKPYRQYKDFFKWKDFIPNYKFYELIKIHIKNDQTFYGQKNEFGTNGSITVQSFKETIGPRELEKLNFSSFLKKFIKYPKWSRRKKEAPNE